MTPSIKIGNVKFLPHCKLRNKITQFPNNPRANKTTKYLFGL